MSKRETYRALTALFKSAMGTHLPRPIETSIRLMTDTGLPASIFQLIPPLRRIVISDTMSDLPYLGAYFPVRLERTPGSEDVDWKALGWDGEPHMILFPFIPSEWVILHEFGHYLDDTFIRAVHYYNERLVHPDDSLIMEALNPKRLDEFADLYSAMEEEFKRVQAEGKRIVGELFGEEILLTNMWYGKIPGAIVEQNAPSDYAYVNMAEWTAECFQTLCIERDSSSLYYTAPKTSAFMRFFFSGRIFKKMSRKALVAAGV